MYPPLKPMWSGLNALRKPWVLWSLIPLGIVGAICLLPFLARLTVPTQYSPYWLLPSMTVDNGAAAREFRFTFVLSSSSSSGRRRRGRDQREDPPQGAK